VAACPLCGSEIREGSRFCRVCGVRIATAAPGASPKTPEVPSPQGSPSVLRTLIVVAKCGSTGRPFIINMRELEQGVWLMSAGLAISEERAARSSGLESEVDIKQLRWPGGFHCPCCDATGLVRCGKCRRRTCWVKGTMFTCRWCGNRGTVSDVPPRSMGVVADI
jgi:hypothetical protein